MHYRGQRIFDELTNTKLRITREITISTLATLKNLQRVCLVIPRLQINLW